MLLIFPQSLTWLRPPACILCKISLHKISVDLMVLSVNLITWSNKITVVHPVSTFVAEETRAQASKAKLYRFTSAALKSLHQNFLPSKVPYKLYILNVQSCKTYNNKYIITSTQITNTDIFAFVAVLYFKLLICKVLSINKKDNRNC